MFRNLTLLSVFASLTLAGCASKELPLDRADSRDSKAGTTSVIFGATGNDPATLLQGAEWVVEDLNGAGLVKDSVVTLNFGPDGHLSGNASCNRFMSQYTLTGEGLTIAKGASSMMMCEEPLMTQERTFLDLLGDIQQFDLRADGVLILRTGDGRTIQARRGLD